MGTRITDDETVALYDSVSGFAFGPTFESPEMAMSFCKWSEDMDEPDLRTMSQITLSDLHNEWHKNRKCICGDAYRVHNEPGVINDSKCKACDECAFFCIDENASYSE